MKSNIEMTREAHYRAMRRVKSKEEKAKEMNEWIAQCVRSERAFLKQYVEEGLKEFGEEAIT